MNTLEKPYNEHEQNWQKTVAEIASFFLAKGLPEDEVSSPRLEELFAKATKRMGHKIDAEKLVVEAKKYILGLKEKGELDESRRTVSICEQCEKSLKEDLAA